MPFEEILGHTRLAVKEIEKAFEAGAKFELGVDKTELGFRLTINCRPWGIYLYPNATEFKERYGDRYQWGAAIVPDATRAGEVVGETRKGITFIYVSAEDYEQFGRDIKHVFELYSNDDFCFRGIPDIWFKELALVRYLRDNLFPHPTMAPWFAPLRLSSTGLWLSHHLLGI